MTAIDLAAGVIDPSYGFGLVQAKLGEPGEVPFDPGPITDFRGSGRRVKKNRETSLTWSGGSARVSVFRNGVRIAIAIANDHAFTDSPPKRGKSFVYRVCDAHGSTSPGSPTCSNDLPIKL